MTVMRMITTKPLHAISACLLPSLILTSLPSLALASEEQEPSQCGLYLAESTIPGAGLGMFAGDRAYRTGEPVGPSDSAVPIYEFEWHNSESYARFLWNEYTWSSDVSDDMDADIEDSESTMHFASSGFGALPNCWMPLTNVADSQVDYLRPIASGASSQSPSIGSFTPFSGRQVAATRDIQPGTELYVSYGEGYFQSRTRVYGYIPFVKNYREADKLLHDYLRLKKRYGEDDREQQPDASTAEIDSSTNQTGDWTASLFTVLDDVKTAWTTSRTLNALPTNVSDVPRILEAGGTSLQHLNTSIRSVEWLREHGKCMDNIDTGISTIPGAGRGVFATRPLAAGSVITPAPLIHIPERDVLRMYSIKVDGNHHVADTDRPEHWQLLLNYCFGHPKTRLLLCPYGVLNFDINHSQEHANAKIAWADDMRNKEWLEQPIDEWGSQYRSGLAFDYVALRDIAEGEEVFLDYGDEWQQAWDAHVAAWDPPRPNYIPAYELNMMETLTLRTWYERPYEHDSVHLRCRSSYIKDHDVSDGDDDDDDSSEKHRSKKDIEDDEDGDAACRILLRNDDAGTYTAELLEEWVNVEMQVIKRNGVLDRSSSEVCEPRPTGQILFDLPLQAFIFSDISYERDHHKVWSFRHEMMIPDELLPDVWKDGTAPPPPPPPEGSS